MCFSFEISMLTGIFSWSVGLFLLQKKLTEYQRNNIIFLLIFSSMQFADAALWYIKLKKNFINFIVTSFLIPIILSLQILFNVYVRNNNTNKLINIAVAFIIIKIFFKFNEYGGYSTGVCDNKISSPIWGSSEITLYEMIVFLLFIGYNTKTGLKSEFLIISLFIILFVRFYFKGGYGSLWCAVTCLLAIKYFIEYKNYPFKA